ncbi:hypothetical protein IE81DRAFT_360396, partial [Ceraceosorus guamensis]
WVARRVASLPHKKLPPIALSLFSSTAHRQKHKTATYPSARRPVQLNAADIAAFRPSTLLSPRRATSTISEKQSHRLLSRKDETSQDSARALLGTGVPLDARVCRTRIHLYHRSHEHVEQDGAAALCLRQADAAAYSHAKDPKNDQRDRQRCAQRRSIRSATLSSCSAGSGTRHAHILETQNETHRSYPRCSSRLDDASSSDG